MKRFWLIALPIVAITLLANPGYTKPQPDPPEHRAMEAALAENGLRLGIVLSKISPHLGLELQELDSDLAGYFQAKPGSGVLITRVEPDSPAQKAGLKSGDIVTEFNDSKITTPEDLRGALSEVKEGSSASITVLRHGKTETFSVTPEQTQYHSMMREMVLPKVEELRNLADSPEFRESMENLRHEMEQMKSQLKLKDDDLRKLKEEVQTEMQKFRDELKQYRKSD